MECAQHVFFVVGLFRSLLFGLDRPQIKKDHESFQSNNSQVIALYCWLQGLRLLLRLLLLLLLPVNWFPPPCPFYMQTNHNNNNNNDKSRFFLSTVMQLLALPWDYILNTSISISQKGYAKPYLPPAAFHVDEAFTRPCLGKQVQVVLTTFQCIFQLCRLAMEASVTSEAASPWPRRLVPPTIYPNAIQLGRKGSTGGMRLVVRGYAQGNPQQNTLVY